MRNVVCPHCGAPNPKSIIITTCKNCGGSLEGAQPAPDEAPALIGPPPPPTPPAPEAPKPETTIPSDLGEDEGETVEEIPPPPLAPPVTPPQPEPRAPVPVMPPPSAPSMAPEQAAKSGPATAKTAGCCACSGVALFVGLVLVAAGTAAAKGGGASGAAVPLLIFGALLGAIGAGGAIWVVRQRLAAGYYEVSADAPSSVGLGESAQWGVTVRARRPMIVGEVSCTLRCQEHAISRGGTSDSHYRKTLFEQSFRVPGKAMQAGEEVALRAPFSVPADAVPSHRSSNNFIEWQVELHAPVPGICPDIKQKADLWVAPTVSGALSRGLPEDPSVALDWMHPDRLHGGQVRLGAAWGTLQPQGGAVVEQTPVMSVGETRDLYLWIQTTEEIACRGVWVWVGCRIHGQGTDEEIQLIAEHQVHEGSVQPGQPVGCPLQVTTPSHGPVSFTGRYVKLEWVARVRFDIPLWFDKRMYVPIVVTPRRLPPPGEG